MKEKYIQNIKDVKRGKISYGDKGMGLGAMFGRAMGGDSQLGT